MKLDNDGRKRLEAMKKALAAGVPLAGLLTAAACSLSGGGLFTVQGRVPDTSREAQLMEQQAAECAPPTAEGEAAEEMVTVGELEVPEPEPEMKEFVTMGKPAPETVRQLMEQQADKCAPPAEEKERIPYPPMSGAPVPTETDAPAEAETEPEMKEFVTMGKPAPETVRQLMEQQADKCAPPAEEKEAPEEWVTVTMGEPAEPRIEPLESEEPEEFVLEGDIMVDDNPPPPPPDGDAP